MTIHRKRTVVVAIMAGSIAMSSALYGSFLGNLSGDMCITYLCLQLVKLDGEDPRGCTWRPPHRLV